MLKNLSVRDFALVQTLDLQLGEGLTVITGESGAGKSILLGALSLVLGERASTDTIRPGAERAEVTVELDLTGSAEARELLEEQALADPDQPERALVRRVVSRDGRSRAFLNGTPVNLAVLRTLARGLIDIHGQDDNVRLSDPDEQRRLLDGYGVNPSDLDACRVSYHRWKQAVFELARREAELASREDRAALIGYQLKELAEVDPIPGEFEEIDRTHRRLARAQSLRIQVAEAISGLEVAQEIERVHGLLSRMNDDHPRLAAARESLLTLSELCRDAVRDLRAFEESLNVDDESLAELESRLEALHDLARKHRVPPESLPEHRDQLADELEKLESEREDLASLAAEAEAEEQRYRSLAAKLSAQRREAAEPFCLAVSKHMNLLGIRGGSLALEFMPRETEYGTESVEFRCITNPRYPAAPLARIASGGERARISLAIQIVAAASNQLPSLILDEADVGVGGTTADVVGRLLRDLASHTQVICITHAPQIAALGQAHLSVTKDSDQNVSIRTLGPAERVDELARMLAGARITDKSRAYARTLLKEAGG